MKNKITKLLISLIGLILFSSCQSKSVTPEAVGLSSDSLKVATQRLHKHVDQGKLPGTFVRIIKDGKTIYNDTYGYIDIKEKKPVDENSLYRIFSMTKPITAVAIMTLYDQGKLTLDDEVSKYIPEFSTTQVYKNKEGKHSTEPQKKPMTIRHLLTHTSGIPYGWEPSYTDSIYAVRQHMRQNWTLEEMTKDLATIPLKFQPGTRYNYGLGIDVAGFIVERVSGMKLDAYFKTAIFDPLNMGNTKFYVPKENKSHLAALYFLDENKQLQLLDDPDITKKIDGDAPPKLLLGGAGLISSMTDYEKFCRMLLNKGTLNGKRILSEKSVSLIMTNQFSEELKSMTTMAHGLSGTVNPKNGEYHWGGAASTSFWINPTDNLIVICYTQLFNSQTQYANEFKATVESALLDK